ncbi:MAG: hypothetical protein QG628_474 [Patescibacteria group bacterium]|nr:hypothetical protein [Patescibacteria group bacterium]
MKAMNTLTRIAIFGLIAGGAMIFYAYIYADWSERTGRTIGANIGAGVVGVFGIQLAIVAGLLLVTSLIFSHYKKK